jgi:hypothetical protein
MGSLLTEDGVLVKGAGGEKQSRNGKITRKIRRGKRGAAEWNSKIPSNSFCIKRDRF